MNIGTAILKAADSIEQNPNLFNFSSIFNPNPDCGTPGCAIGWISLWSGKAWEFPGSAIHKAMGVNTDTCFYKRMNSLVGHGWQLEAAVCAKALRLYADKYHPVTHTGIPEKTLRIFNQELAVA